MKGWSWDQRIDRARELANSNSPAAELLTFYAKIATFQKDVQRQLVDGLVDVAACQPALLALVEREGPRPLAQAAQLSTAHEFFERALQQPYMEHLASRSGFTAGQMRNTCPFCQNKPVVAILRGEGDGAKRSLLCSLCSVEWEFRRILCPQCGEEDRERLPIFSPEQFEYVRIEACDSCQTYLKAIDLTRNGWAVPVVDEIATVALDIWANEHDYAKIESNLLGL